jgi:hypothetical protein
LLLPKLISVYSRELCLLVHVRMSVHLLVADQIHQNPHLGDFGEFELGFQRACTALWQGSRGQSPLV